MKRECTFIKTVVASDVRIWQTLQHETVPNLWNLFETHHKNKIFQALTVSEMSEFRLRLRAKGLYACHIQEANPVDLCGNCLNSWPVCCIPARCFPFTEKGRHGLPDWNQTFFLSGKFLTRMFPVNIPLLDSSWRILQQQYTFLGKRG